MVCDVELGKFFFKNGELKQKRHVPVFLTCLCLESPRLDVDLIDVEILSSNPEYSLGLRKNLETVYSVSPCDPTVICVALQVCVCEMIRVWTREFGRRGH